jgi:hypothetical protein
LGGAGGVEERSFVAKGAPLDDGQWRFGCRTRRLEEEDRLGDRAKDQRFNTENTEKCGRHGEFRTGGLESKRDPSSRKALLWMTAKYGVAMRQPSSSPSKSWRELQVRLDDRTGRLGEEDHLNPHPLLRCAKSAAPGIAATVGRR